MNRKKLILGTGTFVALTALALAHHVALALQGVDHSAGGALVEV